jgi:hypothetical protein
MKLSGTRCLTTTDQAARHAVVFSFFVLRIQNDETQRSLVLFSQPYKVAVSPMLSSSR